MRKILVLATILLVFAAWAVAQQDPTAPSAQAPTAPTAPTAPSQRGQAPPTQDMPAAASQTIEGCLGGGANNFTVTDKSGTTTQLQLPQGTDTDNLSKHVGEEVRVTGSMANGAGGNQMQVSRMNKIADSCGAGAPVNPNK